MQRYKPPKGTRIQPNPEKYGPDFVKATNEDWDRLGALITNPSARLRDVDRTALRMRCGLNGEPRRSFSYIAHTLGLNEEQARGLVAGAIGQVRRPYLRSLWLHDHAATATESTARARSTRSAG